MAQLVATIEGMAEACAFFDAPITGGNVSLYNETLGDPVFPSPVLGIVGVMQTVLPPGIAFRGDGHDIMLIGGIGAADETRMGGTQYAKQVLQQMWGLPPKIDLEFEKRVHNAVREIVIAGLAETAHDLSDGGLVWALAESTFKAGIGATIALDSGLGRSCCCSMKARRAYWFPHRSCREYRRSASAIGVPAPIIGRTGSPG